jgi:hypothetical protein
MEIVLLQLSSVQVAVVVLKTNSEGEKRVQNSCIIYCLGIYMELIEIPCVTNSNKMQNISFYWPVLLTV